ncbi:inositol monophosphatase family protein [Paracoccus sp. (in: a-proteobacteria)]|uniref:inositol monophosphatase family protein n=1 Tax=Paracoccus sp. TaxID=267 RepID=UPI0026E05F72|nr:inositol monophosphatase family protein [Paracoccus sp. (in: a-proteobacteria)]MDO5647142.1 inositol monophosphatase family protein [Paracoccus sp. (in: a-proteobacteria)]
MRGFLETAALLADRAGAIAREAWFQTGDVQFKADGSPVTCADLAVERALRDVIAQRHPTHGILGEEYGAVEVGRSHVWVLDPIDGTRQFAAGLAHFGVLIALCRDGVPVLGVIDMPLMDARWVGADGETRLNGSVVRCAPAAGLDQARVSVANPNSFPGNYRAGYDRLSRMGAMQVFDGGCASYAALARGRLDICINGPDLDPFDICALVPVVQGAGGVISDWQGGALTIHSRGAIVATASDALHRAVLPQLG